MDLGTDGELGVERQWRRATHDVTPAAGAWADRGNSEGMAGWGWRRRQYYYYQINQ